MEALDRKACARLKEMLEAPGAMFLSADCPAGVMTGILRSLDLLVTSRYHACVLSMEKGVPVVALSMDERLDGIMRELGLDREYLLHTDDLDAGPDLLAAMRASWAGRARIRRRILARLPRYKKELDGMGHFMKEYIEDGLRQ